jgi:hypothetical protein
MRSGAASRADRPRSGRLSELLRSLRLEQIAFESMRRFVEPVDRQALFKNALWSAADAISDRVDILRSSLYDSPSSRGAQPAKACARAITR